MIIDNHDLKCENGLRGGGYGSGNRTSDVSIWSNIMFGFAQNKWNNLDVP